MGLLLSVLVTCVGVLEVIACYTHFRIGIAYNECKSNIRDVAKYYAVELRKHELHFETPPPGVDADRGESSTSSKSTVRVQEKSGHWLNTDALQVEVVNKTVLEPALSVSATPVENSPNPAANLKVPRNSICGLDSPTLGQLTSPDINISEVIASTLQNHENDESFWTRKSPSPFPDKSNLEIVEKDSWRSRSPSPLLETKEPDTGLIYTPGLRRPKAPLSPILKTPTSVPNNIYTLVDDSDTIYTDNSHTSERPDLQKYPSLTDLEVQQILNIAEEQPFVPRQPSPYPDVRFGISDNEETKFDEDFLRSLDGVKSPKCDDKRRNFRKKRNSSSTSSRASRDETRSLPSLEEVDQESSKRTSIYQQQSNRSDITPLLEEVILPQYPSDIKEINQNLFRAESVVSEKCESIQTSEPPVIVSDNQNTIKVTKHEEPTYQTSLLPKPSHYNDKKDAKSENVKPGAEVSFTEKVKDLEISVQLMVTVKGASSGDKMEYTTSVSGDATKQNSVSPNPQEEETSTTTTTEENGKFGHLTTSLTVGGSGSPSKTQEKIGESKSGNKLLTITPVASNGIDTEENKQNLKDLQISSQSLICSERATLQNSENEALKLYESFNELAQVEKNKFLRFIASSKVIEDTGKPDSHLKKKQIPTKSETEQSYQESKLVREDVTINQNEQITLREVQEKKNESSKSEKTITEETKLGENEAETTPKEDKRKTNEMFSKPPNDAQPKIDNISESSSEAPSTSIKNALREVSQTSFEEASLSQSEAMLQRRLSNSEISSQQASQAFWVK